MKREIRFSPRTPIVGLCLATAMFVGCGEDGTGPTELTLADLAGSWQVAEFIVTSQANPSLSFDLIAGGGAIHVAIRPSGSFSGTAVVPGALVGIPEVGVVTVPLAGVVHLVDQGSLRIDYIPEIPPVFTVWESDFTLSGDVLTAIDRGAEFDFDDDGTWDPAVFQGTLIRN